MASNAAVKFIPGGPTIREIRNYYFTIEETAYNLNVPVQWIKENMNYLHDSQERWGTWYLSPGDYAILRSLKDND